VKYKWTDPNGNGDYDPGEVNLDKNGPAFLSITGAANNILNSDLKVARTYQYQATLEQEIMPNLAATISFVRLRQNNLYQFVNVLRPYSAYNLAFDRVDPGPDGTSGTADDGKTITIYDYDPKYKGAAFVQNQYQNRPSDRDDTFNTIETTVNKRTTSGWGRWSGQAAFSATKYYQYRSGTSGNPGIVTSPNDNLFPVNDTWDWNWKLNLNVDVPWKIALSESWIQSKGIIGQRLVNFGNLPQSGTLTLPVEPYGVLKSPNRGVLNLRGTRTWKVGKTSFRGIVDVLNVLNGAPPYAINFTSGFNRTTNLVTYGQWSQILSPRILKGGVLFEF
jgi:hypothetical protein